MPPGWLSPGLLPHGKSPPRIISPEENCPPDNCPTENFPPRWLPPDYCPRKTNPKMIAPWQYLTGNGPRGKLPFGWFVAYTIAPRKISLKENCPPKKIVSKINYTRDIFSGRNRKRCPLIDSCFLLFSFFGFVRKNFMSILRLKLLRREEQVKNKLNME